MYKAKLWDENKWNIHSSGYNSSKYSAFSDGKKDDKKYSEQKYGQKEGDVSSDYVRKQDEKEKESKNKANVFEDFEEEKRKRRKLMMRIFPSRQQSRCSMKKNTKQKRLKKGRILTLSKMQSKKPLKRKRR